MLGRYPILIYGLRPDHFMTCGPAHEVIAVITGPVTSRLSLWA
jgi:hypothetical protein